MKMMMVMMVLVVIIGHTIYPSMGPTLSQTHNNT
jgi:hypothetical protein